MHSLLPARRPLRSARQGSVLVVAMIFSLVIAISLVSFLRISTSASQLSYRTYYQGVAMNIAETGLEQAMWEINRQTAVWDKWEDLGSALRTTFPHEKPYYEVEGGAKAVVKVYAREKSGSQPAWVLARAIVTPPRGRPIEKWIKVTLDKKSRLRVGGLGRDGIVASGNNVVMGSWRSDPDKDPSTPYVAFTADLMDDNMSLATLELDASLNSAQADVNGKAAVGGDSLDAIKVGSQGYIGPIGTAAGVKDPNSVSTNFSTDLDIVTAPTATAKNLGSVGSDLTLPTDPASDPWTQDPKTGVITYYYTASQINLTNKTLAITPGYNVVINIPKGSGTALSVGGGSGSIVVGGTLQTNTMTGVKTYTPSSLQIYTDGDVDIGGQGSANTVNLVNYTPATSITGTTTTTIKTTVKIHNPVKALYTGSGSNKVLTGWSYTETVTTVTTIGAGTPKTVVSGPTDRVRPVGNGATAPVPGETTTTYSEPSTTTTITDEVTQLVGSQAGQPVNFQIFGTRSNDAAKTLGMQDIKISGNGNLSGVIYAPNADISAKGGGNAGFVYGSLVGNTLKFTGNDWFIYDESLGDGDDNSRLGIEDWDELVSDNDRATVSNASSQTYKNLMEF